MEQLVKEEKEEIKKEEEGERGRGRWGRGRWLGEEERREREEDYKGGVGVVLGVLGVLGEWICNGDQVKKIPYFASAFIHFFFLQIQDGLKVDIWENIVKKVNFNAFPIRKSSIWVCF